LSKTQSPKTGKRAMPKPEMRQKGGFWWFFTFLTGLFVSKYLENAQGTCPHHSQSNDVDLFLIRFPKKERSTLGVTRLTLFTVLKMP